MKLAKITASGPAIVSGMKIAFLYIGVHSCRTPSISRLRSMMIGPDGAGGRREWLKAHTGSKHILSWQCQDESRNTANS